ncbi:hypothetical protein PAHAL_7G125200 [Panicum hallii]|uniref:Uncharacterized protein n=1 Tax=Panicum hallii TaxID=206008 RepID=A0A2T8IBZ1_9POAL|nr:hypothetical protein PAHAL_7G125200 [Panicum hallii]
MSLEPSTITAPNKARLRPCRHGRGARSRSRRNPSVVPIPSLPFPNNGARRRGARPSPGLRLPAPQPTTPTGKPARPARCSRRAVDFPRRDLSCSVGSGGSPRNLMLVAGSYGCEEGCWVPVGCTQRPISDGNERPVFL